MRYLISSSTNNINHTRLFLNEYFIRTDNPFAADRTFCNLINTICTVAMTTRNGNHRLFCFQTNWAFIFIFRNYFLKNINEKKILFSFYAKYIIFLHTFTLKKILFSCENILHFHAKISYIFMQKYLTCTYIIILVFSYKNNLHFFPRLYVFQY